MVACGPVCLEERIPLSAAKVAGTMIQPLRRTARIAGEFFGRIDLDRQGGPVTGVPLSVDGAAGRALACSSTDHVGVGGVARVALGLGDGRGLLGPIAAADLGLELVALEELPGLRMAHLLLRGAVIEGRLALLIPGQQARLCVVGCTSSISVGIHAAARIAGAGPRHSALATVMCLIARVLGRVALVGKLLEHKLVLVGRKVVGIEFGRVVGRQRAAGCMCAHRGLAYSAQRVGA